MNKTSAVYWLKRDFRLADNPAFTAALLENDHVVPVFIMEPSFVHSPETSAFHIHAITEALKDFRKKIQQAGSDVVIIAGEVIPTLATLLEKYPFQKIYAHEEIGIERTYARDRAVHEWCAQNKIAFKEYQQTGVFRRLDSRNKRHENWRKFNTAPLLPIPNNLEKCFVPPGWKSLKLNKRKSLTPESVNCTLTEIQKKHVQPVSETDAEKTLESFLFERALGYSKAISSPLTAFTKGSRLSVHLAWGTITGRTVYQKTLERIEELKELRLAGDPDAGKFASSLRAFSSRLHWRDHFIQRLESEPNMEFEALNPAYRHLEYDDNPEFLDAWINGKTGYPMVDACIRCLQATGFVNFRMRAMLTSFACHTLKINWKLIDHPMARLYTDYEPGIHLSQLQMQAAVVGINTVRVYSPTKQIADQDPDAIFIKQWVPELREFSPKTILGHRDESLGDYPAQLVDWKISSGEMKQRIYAIRRTENYRAIAEKVYQKHGSRRMKPKKKNTTTKNKSAAAKAKNTTPIKRKVSTKRNTKKSA